MQMAGTAWVDSVAAVIRGNASGAYVNYIDGRLPDWPRAYYGANLERLSRVKRAVDPDGVFMFNQSIPAAAEEVVRGDKLCRVS